MAIILSAMVALLPLILAPHLLFYYDVTPKVAVSRSRELTRRRKIAKKHRANTPITC